MHRPFGQRAAGPLSLLRGCIPKKLSDVDDPLLRRSQYGSPSKDEPRADLTPSLLYFTNPPIIHR